MKSPESILSVLNLEQLGQFKFWIPGQEHIESYGVNWQTIVFIGGMMTMRDKADDSQMAGFLSYAMPLSVEGAKVKFGVSFAQHSNAADATAFGGRVRFNYDF